MEKILGNGSFEAKPRNLGQVQTNVEQISNFDMKHKTIICLRVGRQSNMSTVSHFKRWFSPQGLSNIKFNISVKNKEKRFKWEREREREREREIKRENEAHRDSHLKFFLTRVTNQIRWRCCVENITITIIIIIIIISITYVVSSNFD